MNISHKVEIKPNNKAITYFKKSFGCSRFAYNWALGKYKEYYEKGKKKDELSLSDRVYVCDCGLKLDRDYNASLNLFNLISSVGRVPPELTPVDFAGSVPLAKALLEDLQKNLLITSKVETGIQLREIS